VPPSLRRRPEIRDRNIRTWGLPTKTSRENVQSTESPGIREKDADAKMEKRVEMQNGGPHDNAVRLARLIPPSLGKGEKGGVLGGNQRGVNRPPESGEDIGTHGVDHELFYTQKKRLFLKTVKNLRQVPIKEAEGARWHD